jgi:hypothetical protein
LKAFLLYVSCCFCTAAAAQQSLVCKVIASGGEIISSAYIKGATCDDAAKTTIFQLSRAGIIRLGLPENQSCWILDVLAHGYKGQQLRLNRQDIRANDTIVVQLEKKEAVVLPDVVVRSKVLPITIKNDTTNYKIEKFVNGTERKLQDILEKLPGIEVNKKTGEIRFKGKPIEALMLDGDDLFGKNYQTGSKNISASMIEGVQAIENFSDNYVLKNFEKEEKVALNIKLKKTGLKVNLNLDAGTGTLNDTGLASDYNLNLLGLNREHKFFAMGSYNNIGLNRSVKNFSGNVRNMAQRENTPYLVPKFLPESNFMTPLENQRVNNNSELFGNYNGLFKLGERMSIKLNGFYTADRMSLLQNSSTVFFLGNDTVANIDNISNVKRPSSIDGELYVRNSFSSKVLLENKTTFFNEKVRQTRDIVTNFIPRANGHLNAGNLFVKHQTKLSARISNQHALQVVAVYANNDLDEQMQLSPAIFRRTTAEAEWQSNAYKRLQWEAKAILLGKMKGGVYSFSVAGNGSNNHFRSSLESRKGGLVEYVNAGNDMAYRRQEWKHGGSMDYRFSQWKIAPAYTVTWLQQQLTDRYGRLAVSTSNRLVLEPQVNFSRYLGTKQTLNLLFSLRQKPEVEQHIFGNNLLQTNRFVTANIPNLALIKEFYASLGHSYRDLYNQFETAAEIAYNQQVGNYLASYNVSDTVIYERLFFKPVSNRSITGDWMIKKYFPAIRSTFKLTANYNHATYNNSLSDTAIRNNVNKIISIELYYKSVFKGPINFSNVCGFSNNTFVNRDAANVGRFSVNALQNNLETIIQLNKRLLLTTNFDTYLPNMDNWDSHLHFLDATLGYSTKNKKCEIRLQGKNLLGNNRFVVFQNSDFSKAVNETNLLPRSITLHVSYAL